jgi:hypothetical protein
LHKEGGALAKKSAALFTEPMAWLEDQFRAIGQAKDARELAVHFFAAVQGMAVVAYGSHDPKRVGMETRRLKGLDQSVVKEGDRGTP